MSVGTARVPCATKPEQVWGEERQRETAPTADPGRDAGGVWGWGGCSALPIAPRLCLCWKFIVVLPGPKAELVQMQ